MIFFSYLHGLCIFGRTEVDKVSFLSHMKDIYSCHDLSLLMWNMITWLRFVRFLHWSYFCFPFPRSILKNKVILFNPLRCHFFQALTTENKKMYGCILTCIYKILVNISYVIACIYIKLPCYVTDVPNYNSLPAWVTLASSPCLSINTHSKGEKSCSHHPFI